MVLAFEVVVDVERTASVAHVDGVEVMGACKMFKQRGLKNAYDETACIG